MLGLGASLAKGGASLLTYVKDNLKLYLDFTSNKSNTLKFPSEGSTSFAYADKVTFTQQTFTGAFSVVCWFNGDVNTDYKRLFGDSSPPSGTNDILVKDTNGQVSIRINGSYKANINNVPNNTWSHLAFTRDDNGNIKSYLNGVASGTHTSTDTFTLDNIGGDGGGAVMSMCNAGLWSRELSQEEVQSIMNKSYSQLKGVEKTSLVSWWALDSQSNGVVQPATGEELGDELVDNNTSSGWVDNSDGSTITNITNGVSIADDSGFSDIGYFRDSSILSTDLTVGKLYKVQVDAYHNGVTTVELRIRDGSSNQLINLTSSNTTYTRYIVAQHATGGSIRTNNHASGSIAYLTNLSIKEVTSNTGFVTGATTTTSVYGGNAPILPRAVDVAKEGQADAIGNGSASFNGSSDRIIIDKTHVLGTNPFTMTAWARNTVHGGQYKGVVSMGSATTNGSTYVGIVPYNKWGFGTFSAINQDINETTVIGQWEHLAVTNDGTNIKMYFNGILKNSQSVGSLNITDHGTFIGGIANSTSYPFDGDISQVGIWQGALTQAQIQSVMESTSYSKIPADVKSTLSSELFTSATNNTGWSYDSSAETLTASSTSATAYTNVLSGVSEGDLVKLSFDVTGHTGGSVYISCGGGNSNTSDFTNGSHTIYLVSGSGSQKIAFDGGTPYTAVLSNISVKEVTNDIVAYYPLDGDSSANGVTQDVTTGEVLGSEIASNNFGGWTLNGWTDNGDETASANNSSGGNQDLTLSYSFTASTLYKVTATFSNISGNFYYSMDGTGGLDKTITTNGEQILYVKTSGSGANSFFIRSSNGSSATIFNVSIKEITSNTGVLY